MESKERVLPKKKRTLVAKIANVLSYILVTVFFVVVLAIILIQTQPVQNYVRLKVQEYLQKKLKTKVQIGKVDITFPNSILLENVYVEDQTKDTLLSGGSIKVKIDMPRLFWNEVQIREIDLQNFITKIKRVNQDTVFNFQFILDAFMSTQKNTSVVHDTSTLKMNIDKIVLNNARIIYQDVITGDDMNLFITHLDAPIKTFDPNHLVFDVPTFNLTGLKGYYYQNEPLRPKIDSAIAKAVSTPGNYLQVWNNEMQLKNIDLDYKSVPTNIFTALRLTNLTARPGNLDIRNGRFSFKDIFLDSSDVLVEMGPTKPVPRTPVQQLAKEELPPYTILSNNVQISHSNFRLDYTDMPILHNGMDYGHLEIQNINLTATNFLNNPDTTSAIISSANLKEKSGFILNELNTSFLLSPTEIHLNNTYIKTPGTALRKDFIITYPSLEILSNNPATLNMNLDIESSKVQVKDLLTFAPMLRTLPAFANPSEILDLNGRVTGRLNDLHLNDFRFKGFSNTTLLASGSLKGLPDPKKFVADLDIKYLNTGRKDVFSLIPKNLVPTSFTLPESFSAAGRIKAGTNDIVSDLKVSSSLGSARLKGTLLNYTNSKTAKYDYAVNANGIDLGTIMKDKKTFGVLSATFNIKGTGYDPQVANATANGVINSIGYNQYTYRNINFDGSIANKSYKLTADVADPNITLDVVASGMFNGKYPSVNLIANIDSIKTQPLHFTSQPLIYYGKIEADMADTDPDHPAGNILITNSVMVNNGQRMQMDSIKFLADNSNNQETILAQSQFMYVEMKGQYKSSQLDDIFQQSFDPYFSLSNKKNTNKVDPYNFTLTGKAFDHPALSALLPDLKKIDSITLSANFSTQNGMNANLSAPIIIYGPYEIQQFKFSSVTKNNQLQLSTSINHFRMGSQISIHATTMDGTMANNNFDFTLNVKDAENKDQYRISALLSEPSGDNYTLKLKPDGLLLNHQAWTVDPNNSIELNNGDIVANQFVLSRGNQKLSLNSVGVGTNRPVSIDFTNFNISTVSAFLQSDSQFVNGTVNGNAMLKNYKTQPSFTTSLSIKDFAIYNDTLGVLTAQVNNNTANDFNTHLTLGGKGNDVKLDGDYFLKPNNQSAYNFNLNIASLRMKSLEGPALNSIRYSNGSINGNIAFKGTLDNPDIAGKLNFDNASFNLTQLNSFFRINGQSVSVDNNGIAFNNFTIQDTANDDLVIDGRINTDNFRDYDFNLKVKADNFQASNTTKKDNKIFYGQLYLTTALNIKGTSALPIVEGSLTVNDRTRYSVVLPQSEPGVVEREGIVRFVKVNATNEDSLFMSTYDSLNISKITGMNISVNIAVDRNAEFSLVIDEGNGDFIKIRGEALLNAGIDPSGKVTLVGSYIIDQGSYELTFNFLKRKFDIQKGSSIVWNGEPTNANINVSGVYIANASPLELVQNQISAQTQQIRNTYLQKIPFEVWLTLNGDLLRPVITFDIRLPDDKNYIVDKGIITSVQNKLIQIREEPAEINKQVFALLLLNRFVNENPFDNSFGGLDPEEFARQSVSKLLSEQLNNLAGGLIAGVDLNFDLTTASDYTTGEKRNRTDFTIGLTKQLLGDRLTVNVGTNFEIEGPRPANQNSNSSLAPNIAVDYKLSRDGRYLLRAYQKNQYEGVIEGYVVETGISFIINVDYNHFRELLMRSKSKIPAKVPVTSPSSELPKNPSPVKPESVPTKKQ